MTEYQFDDSLKNKIRDHRSPVPDDMWKRIIQKKDEDRKGFLFFFRWFTVLIIGVPLVGYLLTNHTKQKPEPVNHVLSSQDRKASQAGSASHLNKEEVRTEKNSSAVNEHLSTSKKGLYSSNPTPSGKKGSYSSSQGRELKENERNFKSVRDEKAVSKTAANGIQNSSLQKDSLAKGKEDSVLNAKGVENKPAPVVKPVPDKSPADSTQKAAVKKSRNDSAVDKKWYLDLYASPDWPIDHTGYTSSNFKLSYTIGLRINRAFGKHFSGKIGIQFSQINFTDSLSYRNGAVNHLKSFDLPVLAGYSFGDEKLKMTVTAGGILNISTSIPDNSSAYFFKTNTGFSLYLGFNLEKKINQKISIYLEPYYRYRLTSMTVSTSPYKKFIDVAGLSFGTRYYFLKPKRK